VIESERLTCRPRRCDGNDEFDVVIPDGTTPVAAMKITKRQYLTYTAQGGRWGTP